MRQVYPDVWVQALLSRIESRGLQKVVVDDVRFRNEADTLRKAGFLMLRIEAPEKIRKARLPQGYPESAFLHPSETGLDDYQGWHYVIDGRERVENFKAAVLTTVRAWMENQEDEAWRSITMDSSSGGGTNRVTESDPQEVFDGQGA